jgi:hypothetical protein
MEKEHKFFERVVRSDIPSLEKFVLELNDDLHDGLFPDITKEEVIAKKEIVGDAIGTSFAHKYNIFQFLNSDIRKLHQAIRDMTIEACDYYGVDFNKQEYMLQGWFNCDNKSSDNLNDLHDHCGGVGLPFFHGYYCVNAEPSNTYYKIGGIDVHLYNFPPEIISALTISKSGKSSHNCSILGRNKVSMGSKCKGN